VIIPVCLLLAYIATCAAVAYVLANRSSRKYQMAILAAFQPLITQLEDAATSLTASAALVAAAAAGDGILPAGAASAQDVSDTLAAVTNAAGNVSTGAAAVASALIPGTTTTTPPATGTVTISPTTITGSVGTPISQTLTVSGGTAPYSIAGDPGAPPPAADVSLSGDVLSVGGLTAESTETVLIATDANGLQSAPTTISITIS